jgi:hypothetical protein
MEARQDIIRTGRRILNLNAHHGPVRDFPAITTPNSPPWSVFAAYQHGGKDSDRLLSAKLGAIWYRIETADGQRADRYRIKRTWSRELSHLCHRLIRKILGHTVMAWVAASNGKPTVTFDRLLEAA